MCFFSTSSDIDQAALRAEAEAAMLNNVKRLELHKAAPEPRLLAADPCVRCGRLITTPILPLGLRDSAGRAWHLHCAAEALAALPTREETIVAQIAPIAYAQLKDSHE